MLRMLCATGFFALGLVGMSPFSHGSDQAPEADQAWNNVLATHQEISAFPSDSVYTPAMYLETLEALRDVWKAWELLKPKFAHFKGLAESSPRLKVVFAYPFSTKAIQLCTHIIKTEETDQSLLKKLLKFGDDYRQEREQGETIYEIFGKMGGASPQDPDQSLFQQEFIKILQDIVVMKSVAQIGVPGNTIKQFEQAVCCALPSLETKSFAEIAPVGTEGEKLKMFDASLMTALAKDLGNINAIGARFPTLIKIMQKERTGDAILDEIIARTAGVAVFANVELVQHLMATVFYIGGLYAEKSMAKSATIEFAPFKMRLSCGED